MRTSDHEDAEKRWFRTNSRGYTLEEADLVCAAKDKDISELYPNVTREIVRKAFPNLLTDVQPNQFSKKKTIMSEWQDAIFELDDIVRLIKLETQTFYEKVISL